MATRSESGTSTPVYKPDPERAMAEWQRDKWVEVDKYNAAGHLQGRHLLARVDAAYIVGLEARGLSPQARRLMQSGDVEVCERTIT